MECTYEFYMRRNERLRIVFENFKVSKGEINKSVLSTVISGVTGQNVVLHASLSSCTQDYLQMYSIYGDGKEVDMGTLCGQCLPGPVVSEEGATQMRIQFWSNTDGVVDGGFRARYEFHTTDPSMRELQKSLSVGSWSLFVQLLASIYRL